MISSNVEDTFFHYWFRCSKGNAIDCSNWNAVKTVRCPYFLHDNAGICLAIKSHLTVGDAIHIAVEECVEVTVVLPIEDGVLFSWLLCICRYWVRHDKY